MKSDTWQAHLPPVRPSTGACLPCFTKHATRARLVIMTYSLVSPPPTPPSLLSVIEDFASLTMKSTSKSNDDSRLLNIIPEVRLAIWKLALPRGQKLILDPENIGVPGAMQKGDYAATASLLRVCKQIYDEVLPLVYSRNAIAVLEPWDDSIKDLAVLPRIALQHIKKVELRLIDGLVDMNTCGQTILAGDLPSLKHLRLNFWHARLWLRTAMELAYRSYRASELGEPGFVLKLELYQTVHDMGYINPLDDDIIDLDFDIAKKHARVYSLTIPNTLKTIALSASAGTDAAYALATYKSIQTDWRFNKDGNKDTKAVKYLVWEVEQS